MKRWFSGLVGLALTGGAAAEPLYRYLSGVTGDPPRWNFHKYLLDRQGRVVGSSPSQVDPQDARLIDAIEALL
jgi:glutathione peroxidase